MLSLVQIARLCKPACEMAWLAFGPSCPASQPFLRGCVRRPYLTWPSSSTPNSTAMPNKRCLSPIFCRMWPGLLWRPWSLYNNNNNELCNKTVYSRGVFPEDDTMSNSIDVPCVKTSRLLPCDAETVSWLAWSTRSKWASASSPAEGKRAAMSGRGPRSSILCAKI